MWSRNMGEMSKCPWDDDAPGGLAPGMTMMMRREDSGLAPGMTMMMRWEDQVWPLDRYLQ